MKEESADFNKRMLEMDRKIELARIDLMMTVMHGVENETIKNIVKIIEEMLIEYTPERNQWANKTLKELLKKIETMKRPFQKTNQEEK